MPQGSVLGPPSLLCLHCITRFCHSETWLFISLLCWWHSTRTSHSILNDPMIAARISACLTDISCWMKDHQLQLNRAKTELLVVHQTHHVITIYHPVRHINHNSFKNSQKPWMIDDQLTLRRSGPFFRNMLHNSLFKLMFFPGWLLQCSLGRSSSQFYQTFTINPERGSKINF